MIRHGPAVSVYRPFLRMYPRHFRDEYGADMVALFGEQLGDDDGPSVHGLPSTSPSPSPPAGSNLPMVAIAVLVAVIAAGLALLDRSRNAPIVPPAADRWWKLLTAGAALPVTMAVVTGITGEVP